MPDEWKKKGIVYLSDNSAMPCYQYEDFRSSCEKEGDWKWPPYDDLIDVDLETEVMTILHHTRQHETGSAVYQKYCYAAGIAYRTSPHQRGRI